MIDLHCHIIYGTDDGAKTIEESISMIKEARNAGFTKLCCTPHYLIQQYTNSQKENNEKLQKIKNALDEEKVDDIVLYLGNEVYITENINRLVEMKIVSKMADTDYILIELPRLFEYSYTITEIEKLIFKGYKVILAHPERYLYVQKDIKYLDDFISLGVCLQGNYESLLGKYGHKAKKTLIKLIKQQKIDLLSTDCHKNNSTYIKMNDILKILKKYAKGDYFKKITNDNQENILKNRKIKIM